MASEDKAAPVPAGPSAADALNEPGIPALFAWGDVEGDGRLDLAAIGIEGTLRLLTSAGDGRFEDVTERAGLAGVENAALALWADYDADGRLDLFVGAQDGASRLFHNEGGIFVDMGAGSGLESEGAVQSAQWFDHDGDGRLDLFLVTAEKSELFRGLEGGFFEVAELRLAGVGSARELRGPPVGGNAFETPLLSGSAFEKEAGGRTGSSIGDRGDRPVPRARLVSGPGPGGGSATPLVGDRGCMPSMLDQANSSTCIKASTSPALGRLYPLSANLFVAVGGNVGIGTTTPAAKLDVAGTARMTGTLTLAPGNDTALNVSTGSIYKAGALFLHTKGGAGNTALGREALTNVTTGAFNAACGHRALFSNTTGTGNTASGYWALNANTTGDANTASGDLALYNNMTGDNNTACGFRALLTNMTGSNNTASGENALSNNTTGFNNTASGYRALFANNAGAYNTASGSRALYWNTTGDYNTAIGVSALYNNTTGFSNTASGSRALFSNTSGTSNTAAGYHALSSNATGSGNTASGSSALLSNTSGNGGTACGFRALGDNTSGSFNTAGGSYALASNTTGTRNAAFGADSLRNNTTGTRNAASGYQALRSNITGSFNAACGEGALHNNTTGNGNTASGLSALYANNGSHNTANGYWALRFNTTGSSNTGCGKYALRSNTTGSGNIALGAGSGSSLTTGSDNIAIGNTGVAAEGSTIRIGTSGTQTRAFVAGIHGVTTGGSAISVLVDSSGQLGTVSSSRRFKEEIRDMGDATERLLELRPVTFRYKPEVQSGERPLEYGLIAEEVAEVFPDLVVYDDEGQPFTVKYHLLSSMLLNELKEQARELAEQRSELTRLRDLEARLAALESRDLPAAPPREAR